MEVTTKDEIFWDKISKRERCDYTAYTANTVVKCGMRGGQGRYIRNASRGFIAATIHHAYKKMSIHILDALTPTSVISTFVKPELVDATGRLQCGCQMVQELRKVRSNEYHTRNGLSSEGWILEALSSYVVTGLRGRKEKENRYTPAADICNFRNVAATISGRKVCSSSPPGRLRQKKKRNVNLEMYICRAPSFNFISLSLSLSLPPPSMIRGMLGLLLLLSIFVKLHIGFYLVTLLLSTMRHNTQITHITQNNIPRSNKSQHTKLHKQ
jgi:hypothetical protein